MEDLILQGTEQSYLWVKVTMPLSDALLEAAVRG